MEILEAEKILKNIEVTSFNTSNIYLNPKKVNMAIENVLNALENSISKDRIRKYIKTLEDKLKEYKVNMGGKEYIVMSYLDKEEKELVHNIMIQIATLKDLLEEE